MMISTEKESNLFLEVNSCGRQHLNDRDWNTHRPRGRVDYHILYIARGCCYVEFDHTEYAVGAGHLIVFPPMEPQKYHFLQQDDSVSCYIHFSGTECERLLTQFGLNSQHIYNIGTQHALEKIIVEMENEYVLQRPFARESCSAHLLQFLAAAGRLVSFQQDTMTLKSRKSIEEVCKYIHWHYQENHPIQYYAQMCHLSESRFSHAFKECTGCTPKAYLLSRKLNAARRLIEDTDLSLADIAELTGFEDSNYFSRIFKKVMGHSPSYYRQ